MFKKIGDVLESRKLTPLLVFTIDSGAPKDNTQSLCESSDNRPLLIHVGEYGIEKDWMRHETLFNNVGKILDASMGLEDKSAYGIKISPTEPLSSEEKYKRLQAFEHSALKEALLPSFQENALFVGYMQGSGSALGYMLAGIQMQTSGSKSLNCDFFLDRQSIDKWDEEKKEELMEYFTREIKKAFGPCTLEFITENPQSKSLDTVSMGNAPRRIRVFYGIHLSNRDYQALRTLTDNPGGCSGDSSFSDVVSSQGIFYFSDDTTHNFTCLFTQQLRNFFGRSGYDTRFACLVEYCRKSQPQHDFDIAVEFWNKQTKDDGKNIYERHFELGKLLQNPQLHEEWKAFREILIHDYNYYAHLQNIAKMGCLLEYDDAFVAELFEQAEIRESYKQSIQGYPLSDYRKRRICRAIDNAGSLTDAKIIYDEFVEKYNAKPEDDPRPSMTP